MQRLTESRSRDKMPVSAFWVLIAATFVLHLSRTQLSNQAVTVSHSLTHTHTPFYFYLCEDT